MTQLSIPWPKVGPNDGRAYTDAEWRTIWNACFNTEGVLLDYLNELTVTVTGANALSVDTGAAFVVGAFYHNSAAVALAPVSAPAGETRLCSVILEQDHTGGGSTGQYTVRLLAVTGTAVAYPVLTQTVNVLWQMRLYNFTIDDAGAITGLARVCYPSHFRTEVNLAMMLTGMFTANAAGRAPFANGWMIHEKMSAGERFIVGMVMPFSGTLGGSDGHRPIDPDTAAADENWHLCNGDVVGGVATPDLRDRMVIAAGPTYAATATGGAATKNLQHTHTGPSHTHTGPSHTHSDGTLAAAVDAVHATLVPAGAPATAASAQDHVHDITGSTGAGGTGATGAGGTGNTGNGGSTTQDVMNPYYSLSYIMRVANT